jgi:hypothetical protein
MSGSSYRRDRRPGSVGDDDVIRLEAFVKGLDGVVNGGLDDGQVEENDRAGTRWGRWWRRR